MLRVGTHCLNRACCIKALAPMLRVGAPSWCRFTTLETRPRFHMQNVQMRAAVSFPRRAWERALEVLMQQALNTLAQYDILTTSYYAGMISYDSRAVPRFLEEGGVLDTCITTHRLYDNEEPWHVLVERLPLKLPHINTIVLIKIILALINLARSHTGHSSAYRA